MKDQIFTQYKIKIRQVRERKNLAEEKIVKQKKRIQNVGKFGPAYHKKYNALHGKKYWDKIKQGKIESKFKKRYGKSLSKNKEVADNELKQLYDII